MTESRRRALTIIRKHGRGLARPGEFANLMWPKSPAWAKVTRVGVGAAQGVGIVRSAGAYLGRLRKAGLINGHGGQLGYWVTPAGEDALEETA